MYYWFVVRNKITGEDVALCKHIDEAYALIEQKYEETRQPHIMHAVPRPKDIEDVIGQPPIECESEEVNDEKIF